IASDVTDPDIGGALNALRDRLETSSVPIVVISKPKQMMLVANLIRRFTGVETVLSEILTLDAHDRIEKSISEKLSDAPAALGSKPLDKARPLSLALQAADALRMLALARSSLFDFQRAEGALIAALSQPSESLRIKAASVLALADSATAQKAIATAALD